jgi:hypothetical protein
MADPLVPIDMTKWRDLPCVRGAIATRLDSEEGRAAFFIPRTVGDAPKLVIEEGTIAEDVQPIPIEIPSCAILHSDEGDLPVIVIQAERTSHNGIGNELAGYRSAEGGVGVCMLHELEIIGDPDDRFFP